MLSMKLLLFSIFFFLSVHAYAKDCELIPQKSLCGISLHSTKEEYFEVLGIPSSEIKLSENSFGYFFANRRNNILFMLVFTKNKITEIRTWETNPNIDFWFLLPQKEAINLIINGVKLIGLQRSELEKIDHKFPLIDADQFAENRQYSNFKIDLFYAPFYGPSSYDNHDLNEFEKYKCQSVTVRNINSLQ